MDVSARVDDLAAVVSGLEQRLARLEQRAPPLAAASVPPPPAAPRAPAFDLAPVGLSVVAVGGAYLLRAVTDLEAVPDGVGAVLGLVYGAALLFIADRALARGRATPGTLGVGTALLCAYPLIGEMVVRFHVLSPETGAIALVAWYGALVAVAARRRTVAVAWIAVVGTAGAAVALTFATQLSLPFVWALTAVAALTLWLGERQGQRLLVAPVAILADLLVALVLALVVGGRAPWPATTAAALGLVYFLVFVAGALRAPRAFELTQCAIAFAVGFGGAAWVAVTQGHGTIFGAVGLAVAAAGTALTIRRGVFWVSLWCAATVLSLLAMTSGPLLGFACAALGLALIVGRRLHPLAAAHGVVALIAAALASGLLAAALRGLLAVPAQLAPPRPEALAVLAALVVALALVLRDADRGRVALVTRLGDLVITSFAAVGLLVGVAIVAAGASPAAAATLRTAALALSAVGLAAASRSPRAWPAGLLVYPVLAAGAVKLLMQDFVVGRPLTQTAGLLMYGMALILAPRLRGTAARSGGTDTGSGTAA